MMNGSATIIRGDISEELLHAFRAAGRVAWDIETSGLDWRRERIGTCQLYSPDVGAILVNVGSETPNRLRRLLIDPTVSKLFHHAMFDLRFMAFAWQARPASIECTKVASKLVWPRAEGSHHSLQSLLVNLLDRRISKAQRVTDWLSQELTDDQIDYAISDVKYLPQLLDRLCSELEAGGITDLYRECMAFLPTRVRLEIGEWPDVFTY